MNLTRWTTITATLTLLVGIARSDPSAAPSMSEQSLYQLGSHWTTDAGRELQLVELAGHYQMVAFIFTQCGAVCPLAVKSLQAQSRHLPPPLAERIRFLLVSMDPQHDTVAALQQFRKEMALDARWTLLRGRDADVRELAVALGFNYRRLAPGQFSHSNQLTLLDPQGAIVLQHPSADGALLAVTEALSDVR